MSLCIRISHALLIFAGLVVVFIAPAVSAQSSPQAPKTTAALAPGDHRFSVQHDGLDRSYIVHVPPQAKDARPLPVVLNFHGGGGSAQGHKTSSRMDETADREGFLAVYPDGTGRFSGRLLTWNAGTCCGYASDHHIDDVGFVLVLLDDLARRTPVDLSRVYATGMSNGSMMAYRLANDASDRIAAIAPVAGGMAFDQITAPLPVPVMDFHSVDDPRALYHGGEGPPFPMTTRKVIHPDMDKVIAAWVRHNGCVETPTVSATLDQPADGTTKSPRQTATKYLYGGCRDGAEIVHWKLTGAGHVWPGGAPSKFEHLFSLGPATHMIDANSEMWLFFRRFHRSPPSAGSH
jgi:polyhydroxybutyrate depolymerase